MDQTRELFLSILRAALRGETAAIDTAVSPEQWEALLRMAGIHQVLPLFYEAVHGTAAARTLDPAAAAGLRRKVRQQVMVQTIKTADFLELEQRLRAAGVRAMVVKGLVCRSLYPNPDLRPSGDEDVLIAPAQLALCHRVLTEWGMETTLTQEERDSTYEVPYRKAGSPLYIELHKQLFPQGSAAYGDLNRFFDGVYDRAVEQSVQGGRVWTMAPTDHLFYLICHAFKHFLHSGFGIRQVCDILLYAQRHGPDVDWERVLEGCRAIRAHKFAAALFQIGERHLGFDPEAAGYPPSWRNIPVDSGDMLADILGGGLYGDADMSRKHSSAITLDAVAAQKQGKTAKNALLLSAFPPARELEGRYPWLKDRPWLLPAAWADRLVKYRRETTRTRDNTAAAALKIGKERIALMRKYGILEE